METSAAVRTIRVELEWHSGTAPELLVTGEGISGEGISGIRGLEPEPGSMPPDAAILMLLEGVCNKGKMV